MVEPTFQKATGSSQQQSSGTAGNMPDHNKRDEGSTEKGDDTAVASENRRKGPSSHPGPVLVKMSGSETSSGNNTGNDEEEDGNNTSVSPSPTASNNDKESTTSSSNEGDTSTGSESGGDDKASSSANDESGNSNDDGDNNKTKKKKSKLDRSKLRKGKWTVSFSYRQCYTGVIRSVWTERGYAYKCPIGCQSKPDLIVLFAMSSFRWKKKSTHLGSSITLVRGCSRYPRGRRSGRSSRAS